jgi:hypothetical protein
MQRKTPQRKEAQKDLKGQGESKKPGMTKRRQARKVATMVKRQEKPGGFGAAVPGRGRGQPDTRGWMGRTTASHVGSLRPIEGDATSGSATSPCQLNGENPAQRKGRMPG